MMDIKEIGRKCCNCDYLDMIKIGESKKGDLVRYECRRFPPMIVNGVSVFPTIKNIYKTWCGEWTYPTERYSFTYTEKEKTQKWRRL